MDDPARPTNEEVEAAARLLYQEGCFYHWWPNAKSYDEFVSSDPVGLSEFMGTVERMLIAAAKRDEICMNCHRALIL